MITNCENTIDSRDIIARIGYLEEERESLEDDENALAAWDKSDKGEELKSLTSLQDQAAHYSDWDHGATLINENYFETYAQEFAEEIGAIDSDVSWPHNCIDWEQAALELQQDYTAVDFDGTTYYIR